MAGSDRRSPEEIGQILSRLDSSGLSAGEFADQEGVPRSTLYFWRRKFRPAGPRREGVARGRLRRVEPEAHAASSAWFELVMPSGIRLRLPMAATDKQLERILLALTRCSA